MSGAIQAVTMPKWGLAMSEGIVTHWYVEEGDDLAVGDDLADIETTKITNVFESPLAGRLRRRVAPAGETVPVGGLLAVVAESAISDADIEAFITRFEEAFAVRSAAAEAAAPQPGIIEVAGRRLRLLRMGDGGDVPVLFLHGFGADLNNWLFNQPVLAEERTTYAIDLPGHGGSTKEVGAGDVRSMAALVAALLDAVGAEQAHLVGHSLGGAIAIDLARADARRAASLTLIAAAGLGPEINMEFVDGFIAAERRKQLKPVLEMLVDDPALISREMVEDVLKFKRLDGARAALERIAGAAFAGGVQASSLREALEHLQVPVQVIWGRHDWIIPVRHADGLPARVAVHRLDGAGHMVHMEKASEVNALIGALASR